MNSNQAAGLAIKLAKEKAQLCEPLQKSSAASNDENNLTQQPKMNTNSSSSNRNSMTDEQRDEDNYIEMNEDDNDVVVTSNASSRAVSASNELKSMNDALKDAVKFVAEMNQNKEKSAANSEKKNVYLSESRIMNLIKKCKQNLAESKSEDIKMETDDTTRDSADLLSNYKPLFTAIQTVFQSVISLSLSFNFKNPQDAAHMSSTMPSIPPFNIDFNSLRRSYTLLFGLTSNELVSEELEKCIDMAIYTLCFKIRMTLKRMDLPETELDQILHAILVVNELPLLEDPKYMDRCAKIFYATINELPVLGAAKIAKLWSKWHSDELKVYLNKAQQYVTVVVISKNLDEESNRANDEDDDDFNENEKTCLHKNEGVSGAVGYLRLVYYASILGGRVDSEEQIRKERALEVEEMGVFEDTLANEENGSIFSENINMTTHMLDPLEKELGIRAVDCREPKIPYDQFINEVANKYIDIQHDYVEYTKHLQNVETQSHEPTGAAAAATSSTSSSSANNRTRKNNIFSFLANPFFLVLAKKNLGLYYDNKIKMMRERRNNIMMSLIEGRMPTPYFKIRLTRQNLLSEALSLIELQEQENPATLRKQLFVEFENEQGIDQGGVSKEFFQLAIDELLNKGFTFFSLDEKSRYYWFTPTTLETEKEFKLVGILFGIAIYNNVLLDVQFPPVFFRKLVGKLGTLEDLGYSHQDLYKSLTSLLDFQGSDEEFEDTFMQTFQISLTDNFETVVNFNLKEDGDKIPVTKQNRQEFVDLYADFILNKGIEESFKAFRRGFLKIVMNSPLIRWYSPEELEILLCGTKVMDWKSLENSTSYDSGFDAAHKYIKDFWEIFEEFTDEEKKLFLKFTTGTDRCPHGGLSELKLTIARNGPDTEKLPTAHTCFNVLLLPEYSTKQKLKEKLIKAIQYSRGFGLS